MATTDFGIDLDSVRRFQAQKRDRRNRDLDKRFASMWEDFRRIVDRLSANREVRRIYQWGSLLDRRLFSEISDIDVAVEGVVSYEAFSKMLGEAAALTGFPLDMVRIEGVGVENAEYIRSFGKMVYERNRQR